MSYDKKPRTEAMSDGEQTVWRNENGDIVGIRRVSSSASPTFSTAVELPPKGCPVLVYGADWPTAMVAQYDPSDAAFPWVVYAGYDGEKFTIDAFDCWMYLPPMRAR